jgi:hypothetical protein
MSTALGGIPFSDAGALQVQLRPDTGVPSTEPRNGGWAVASALNAAYFEPAGAAVPAAAVELGGIAFTQDGAIYLTQDGSSGTFASIGGHKVRSDGALLVVSGAPAATDPVIGGWAHVGSTRAAYVGGDGLSFALPLRDLGAGAVDTTLALGTGTATFTRATAAAAKLSTGLWKLDVASGVARSQYLGMTTAVGAYGGYLAEGARTNSCLQSRDLTNVAWTNVTMTTAKTSTGIDGVASSCTRCTAAGANSTLTQAITLVSAAKTFSVWLKRVTGTGVVQISLDNFVTNTDVTALINSSTFTLVQMTQTLANPTVGIRLVTSADAIDVDVAQLEDTASFASTPIPTTTIAVTRNADVLNYVLAGNADATVGGAYAEVSTLWSTGPTTAGAIMFGTSEGPLRAQAAADTQILAFDGTTVVSKSGLTAMSTGVRKRASSWGSGISITGDGVAVTAGSFDGSFQTTSIGIGCGATVAQWFGTVKNARLWTRQISDAALVSITA